MKDSPKRYAEADPTKAFSLVELLAVVGLIAGFSGFLVVGAGGAGESAALRSGQALLVNLITAARTAALAGGQSSRIAFQVDAAGEPSRYLRHVVVQAQTAAGWQTLVETSLPDRVYVVPGNFSPIPDGLFAADTVAPWVKMDGSALRSTALRANQVSVEAINQPNAERWASVTVSASSGTVQSGDLILANGRLRTPGSYAAGESPVELRNPEMVRGVTLSAYAVPTLINARTGF